MNNRRNVNSILFWEFYNVFIIFIVRDSFIGSRSVILVSRVRDFGLFLCCIRYVIVFMFVVIGICKIRGVIMMGSCLIKIVLIVIFSGIF